MRIPVALSVFLFLFALFAGMGCQQDRQNQATGDHRPNRQNGGPKARQQAQIDSLTTLVQQLRPGLGEFMVQLKYHHDRLAEAISGKDFERASYEVDEMRETAEKIQQLHISNEKLQDSFSAFYGKYLAAPLENLASAAQSKNLPVLQTNFAALTNNCNGCHRENKMAFMTIR